MKNQYKNLLLAACEKAIKEGDVSCQKDENLRGFLGYELRITHNDKLIVREKNILGETIITEYVIKFGVIEELLSKEEFDNLCEKIRARIISKREDDLKSQIKQQELILLDYLKQE